MADFNTKDFHDDDFFTKEKDLKITFMATRQEVENAIAAIEDNGNNTAKEIRDVLYKLLAYIEKRTS